MTEQMRILKLLDEKKITAEEASRLLDAFGGGDKPARFLKVRVYEQDSTNAKVNVTIPIALVKWGLQFVPESAQMKLNEHKISFEDLERALSSGFSGKLVDVEDDEKGERVEVYLE
jgi:hypothetical protein